MLLAFFLTTLAGIIFSFVTPKCYIAKSHVALFRQRIEDPDMSTEESKNRWVWIRDGLNLQSALVTDLLLNNFLNTNTEVKKLKDVSPNKKINTEYLKSLIKIDFTGADENNFLIEVKAPSPKMALDLNTLIFERLKFLAVETHQQNFLAVLAKLKKKADEIKTNIDTYNFYQSKINKLNFNHTVNQAQREIGFEVISKPTTNLIAIWPKTNLIILCFAIFGIFFGFFLEFILFHYKEKK